MRKTVSGLKRERIREVMSMMEEKQPPHVRKRTSLSETYEELCLILRDGFDGQVLIHEHLNVSKNIKEYPCCKKYSMVMISESAFSCGKQHRLHTTGQAPLLSPT